MSKILVILTGGTIGSCLEEKVISARVERSAEIVKRYERIYGQEHEFEVVQPLNELSENLQPRNWEAVIQELDKALEKDYDGIIVTHGSDTLAYTSAFMAIRYAYVNIPVVFIAANYPLDDERSNGMCNFAGAVTFIKEQPATGVFTIYKNGESEADVFLPTRLLNSDPYFDQYRSFDHEVFGWIQNGKFVKNSDCPVSLEMVANRNTDIVKGLSFHYQNEILLIPAYLGVNFRNYQCNEHTKAVLLYLYHSATGPINDEAGLPEFIERCLEAGIKVYGTSFKGRDINHYQTTHVLLQKGLCPIFNTSEIAAYVKLVLAYNQDKVEPDTLLENNIFFETLE